jgi:hypothetical protein
MAATTDINRESRRARWPRDLKVFAVLAALWAGALTARIVLRDLTPYGDVPLDAVLFGMRFEGYPARLTLAAQAMVIFSLAIGIGAERKWGLLLALAYMVEVIAGNLIFMIANMDDIAQWRDVRIAGLLGAFAVLILLYLWIRGRDLICDEHPRS